MELHKLLSMDYMLESEHNAAMMNKQVQLDAVRVALKSAADYVIHDFLPNIRQFSDSYPDDMEDYLSDIEARFEQFLSDKASA